MTHVPHVESIVLGLVVLLLIGVMVLWLTRRIRFPYTVMLVLVGMGLAGMASMLPGSLEPLHEFVISPDLILFVFLPTLVFESAFNMDLRQLRRNLVPVLLLAVPGLILSTLLIGILVALVTPLSFTTALLLGSILSATDPVAVTALFRQMGAPRRLMVLVEGESLLNDATSVVLARILLAVVTAGAVSWDALATGGSDFIQLFLGGLAVGVGMGYLTGQLLGRLEPDPFIQITLTTVLAYLSFIVAESWLHVSGIMATMGAGLALGGWGRVKISASVRQYLDHFWEFAAYLANTLIFLMVGLRVNIGEVLGTAHSLVWVIVAMLVSRAVVVYGLMPWTGRRPVRIPLSYQTVMFWSGLRGAVSLAIVLSLPVFEHSEMFFPLVMGAVLFTLVIQGTTMPLLMKRLGLSERTLADRMAALEVELASARRAMKWIGDLMRTGLFSGAIGEALISRCHQDIQGIQSRMEKLRSSELHRELEGQMLHLRCMREEHALYMDLFAKGHLGEGSVRELLAELAMESDSVRHHRLTAKDRVRVAKRHPVENFLLSALDRFSVAARLAERIRQNRVAVRYEEAWGRYQACARVLERMNELAGLEGIPATVVDAARQVYEGWRDEARSHLDRMAEQFPEFVGEVQERLGKRLRLVAEMETTTEHLEQGTLSREVGEAMLEHIEKELKWMRGQVAGRLHIEPGELLLQAHFFQGIPESVLEHISKCMKPRTVEEGEVILKQGQGGESLFFIARGVVRIFRTDHHGARDLATLMAGDFFGEMALLHAKARVASARAVTPCLLYELTRTDLAGTMEQHPLIRQRLEASDRSRRESMQGAGMLLED